MYNVFKSSKIKIKMDKNKQPLMPLKLFKVEIFVLGLWSLVQTGSTIMSEQSFFCQALLLF